MEIEHKPEWYLISVIYQAHQKVDEGMRAISAEIFSPLMETVVKSGALGVRRSSRVQLFPGYIFVRINPEVIPLSAIASMSGVKEFVRFGGSYCVVSDRVVDALRASMVMRLNRNVTRIEFSGVSADILESIRKILELKDKSARQLALMDLVQKDASIQRSMKSKFSSIATTLETPPVNDTIP